MVNQLEHVAKKKAQLTANVVNQRQHVIKEKTQMTVNEVRKIEHVVRKRAPLTVDEMKHFQAEQRTIEHNVSGNEAFHLQQMIHQHQSNRLIDEYSQIETFASNEHDFQLRNPQLSMQEAVNFLNLKDPLQHKWSDFEKSPVKSLLLWYANAGCFAFDEYKEYVWHSMVSKWMSKDLRRKLAMKHYQIKNLEIS